jgi:hypothetical protein
VAHSFSKICWNHQSPSIIAITLLLGLPQPSAYVRCASCYPQVVASCSRGPSLLDCLVWWTGRQAGRRADGDMLG